jgi:hypothetical protein
MKGALAILTRFIFTRARADWNNNELPNVASSVLRCFALFCVAPRLLARRNAAQRGRSGHSFILRYPQQFELLNWFTRNSTHRIRVEANLRTWQYCEYPVTK